MKGIYKISCSQDINVYIGSSINIYNRWSDHKKHLKAGKHHNSNLQLAWDAYGDESFIFEILEETDDVIQQEQYWLNKHWPNCYNISQNVNNPMASESVAKKQQTSLNASGRRGNQRLTETDVLHIVSLLYEGKSNKYIAEQFNVSTSLIQGIACGQRWSIVTDKTGLPTRRKHIDADAIILITEKVNNKESLSAIAKSLGVDYTTIRTWVRKLNLRPPS